MIPFQLGFRNLIGILVPGAVLALVIFTCLDIIFPGTGQAIARETGNVTGSLALGLLLAAYVLGSVIRLHSSDTVDRYSAGLVQCTDPFEGVSSDVGNNLNALQYCVAKLKPGESERDYFKDLLYRARIRARYPDSDPFEIADSVGNPATNTMPPDDLAGKDCRGEDLIRWAWVNDEFPYPVWELMKLRLYHPDNVFQFFEDYLRCFATGDRRNKEFFNYCKAVIYEAHEGKRHALAEEVQSAEAYIRFFAGVFWALLLSSGALIVASVPEFVRGKNTAAVGMILVALLMLAVDYFIIIAGRFRLSRLKEVDTVFDAFFLVQQQPSRCPYCNHELPSRIEDT